MSTARAASMGLLLLCTACSAQTNGVRFIFPEFGRLVEGEGFYHTAYMGLGYDRGMNDRLSYGIDFTFDMTRLTQDQYVGIAINYKGYDASYSMEESAFGFEYRTACAFFDSDRTHPYLGTFIGYRSLVRSYVLETGYGSNIGTGIFDNHADLTVRMIPVGIRIGLMGGLEGGYADVYMQLGYNAFVGDSGFTQPYLQGVGFDMRRSVLGIGFSYGGGW